MFEISLRFKMEVLTVKFECELKLMIAYEEQNEIYGGELL